MFECVCDICVLPVVSQENKCGDGHDQLQGPPGVDVVGKTWHNHHANGVDCS